MKLSEQIKALDYNGRDFPLLAGTVKFKLHNVHNGKDEVIEEHNMVTNALADIFAANYGGLLNYQNFAELCDSWLGGVLLFQNALDPSTPNDYGIPARTSNPCVAHAGQTALTDQADDLTRGNPDSSGTVKQVGSVKHVWEWGTSAGNGTISSLGLTHSDVGSYGCGVASEAQKLLNPFADIGNMSRSFAYGDNAVTPMAINGNLAYSFYYVSSTSVDIFVTPINSNKFKLQGGALLPLTGYTTKTTVTIPSCTRMSAGDIYYHFDFTAGTLTLWRVQTEGGTTLLQDVIDLSTFAVTSSTITVTGAQLWKMMIRDLSSAYRDWLTLPIEAIVYNNHLFVYGYTSSRVVADKMFIINLANTADISEVDVSDLNMNFHNGGRDVVRVNLRHTSLGGIIAHDNFIINGDKAFRTSDSYLYDGNGRYISKQGAVSSPVCGVSTSFNVISACKLYLATKYNLPSAVTKTSAQSMTVEYTLTEV